ncbi:MAG: pilus assembly protein, partial [Chitinophagaceae bacterium]|nr:pilus assembly protein [Anaerolineae bacterium]
MRRIARKILQILDGTPAVYGKQERGQSLVEMAFITPLILVLIAGIVEIGWLANNYLTLQEVTKVGARRGTVLTGDLSPLNWDNRGSSLPPSQTGGNTIDSDDASLTGQALIDAQNRRANVRICGQLELVPGFYNIILCTMLDSMEPLIIRFQDDLPVGETAVDDIAISVFAVQTVHNATVTGVPFGTGGNLDVTTNGEVDFDAAPAYVDNDNFEDNTWVSVVVGRYPTNANECNVDENSDLINPPVERDPFDYINDQELTSVPFTVPTGIVSIPLELARQEGAVWVPSGGDGTNPADEYGYGFRER